MTTHHNAPKTLRNTNDDTAPDPAGPSGDGRPTARLRRLLRFNGGFSLLTGAVAAIDAGPVARFLEINQTWLVRSMGVGLMAFAVLLFLIARQPTAPLRRIGPAISMADFGWVAGTAAVVIAGWLSTAGAGMMAAVAVVVLILGVEQLLAVRAVEAGPARA